MLWNIVKQKILIIFLFIIVIVYFSFRVYSIKYVTLYKSSTGVWLFWILIEFLLMNISFYSMYTNILARFDPVNTLAREKSLWFSACEGGIANIIMENRASMRNWSCIYWYRLRTLVTAPLVFIAYWKGQKILSYPLIRMHIILTLRYEGATCTFVVYWCNNRVVHIITGCNII